MQLLLFHKKRTVAKLVKKLGCVWNAKGLPRAKSSLLLVLVRLGNTFNCVSGGRPAGRVLRAVDIGRWCLNKLSSLPREIACIYRGPPNFAFR